MPQQTVKTQLDQLRVLLQNKFRHGELYLGRGDSVCLREPLFFGKIIRIPKPGAMREHQKLEQLISAYLKETYIALSDYKIFRIMWWSNASECEYPPTFTLNRAQCLQRAGYEAEQDVFRRVAEYLPKECLPLGKRPGTMVLVTNANHLAVTHNYEKPDAKLAAKLAEKVTAYIDAMSPSDARAADEVERAKGDLGFRFAEALALGHDGDERRWERLTFTLLEFARAVLIGAPNAVMTDTVDLRDEVGWEAVHTSLRTSIELMMADVEELYQWLPVTIDQDGGLVLLTAASANLAATKEPSRVHAAQILYDATYATLVALGAKASPGRENVSIDDDLLDSAIVRGKSGPLDARERDCKDRLARATLALQEIFDNAQRGSYALKAARKRIERCAHSFVNSDHFAKLLEERSDTLWAEINEFAASFSGSTEKSLEPMDILLDRLNKFADVDIHLSEARASTRDFLVAKIGGLPPGKVKEVAENRNNELRNFVSSLAEGAISASLDVIELTDSGNPSEADYHEFVEADYHLDNPLKFALLAVEADRHLQATGAVTQVHPAALSLAHRDYYRYLLQEHIACEQAALIAANVRPDDLAVRALAAIFRLTEDEVQAVLHRQRNATQTVLPFVRALGEEARSEWRLSEWRSKSHLGGEFLRTLDAFMDDVDLGRDARVSFAIGKKKIGEMAREFVGALQWRSRKLIDKACHVGARGHRILADCGSYVEGLEHDRQGAQRGPLVRDVYGERFTFGAYYLLKEIDGRAPINNARR